MKTRHIISAMLAVLGILMGIGTAWVAVSAVDAPTRILKTPEGARERVSGMMSAVCDGDYEAAAAHFYGSPDLGAVPENADPAVYLLWEAYRESFSDVSLGEPRATDSGVSYEVRISHLNLAAVLDGLDETIRAFVDEKNAAVREDEAPYNVKRDLPRDLTDRILPAVLENPDYVQAETITVDLICDRGRWWVLPTEDLTNMLCGSFTE